MSVTGLDARRIAELARLRLDDDEIERLTADLNRILDHVVELGALGLEEARGVGDPEGRPARLRDPGADAPDPLVRGPDATAPDWRDGFFVVPALPGLSDGVGEDGA